MSDITLYVAKEEIQYPEDVRRIIEELNERSIDALDADVQRAYARYSEEAWCAGWMMLDDNISSVVDSLIDGKYLVPFDEDLT